MSVLDHFTVFDSVLEGSIATGARNCCEQPMEKKRRHGAYSSFIVYSGTVYMSWFSNYPELWICCNVMRNEILPMAHAANLMKNNCRKISMTDSYSIMCHRLRLINNRQTRAKIWPVIKFDYRGALFYYLIMWSDIRISVADIDFKVPACNQCMRQHRMTSNNPSGEEITKYSLRVARTLYIHIVVYVLSQSVWPHSNLVT